MATDWHQSFLSIELRRILEWNLLTFCDTSCVYRNLIPRLLVLPSHSCLFVLVALVHIGVRISSNILPEENIFSFSIPQRSGHTVDVIVLSRVCSSFQAPRRPVLSSISHPITPPSYPLPAGVDVRVQRQNSRGGNHGRSRRRLFSRLHGSGASQESRWNDIHTFFPYTACMVVAIRQSLTNNSDRMLATTYSCPA